MADIDVGSIEIAEAGIALGADDDHVVRVVGARRRESFQDPPMKERLVAATDQSVFDQYYSGALPSPAGADPAATSELFVTESGEPIVVETNLA